MMQSKTKEYRQKYLSGCYEETKYILTNGNETKKFNSREDVGKFLGIAKDTVNRFIRNKRVFYGWSIKRYKWYEQPEEAVIELSEVEKLKLLLLEKDEIIKKLKKELESGKN